jgi:hypothetical protein
MTETREISLFNVDGVQFTVSHPSLHLCKRLTLEEVWLRTIAQHPLFINKRQILIQDYMERFHQGEKYATGKINNKRKYGQERNYVSAQRCKIEGEPVNIKQITNDCSEHRQSQAKKNRRVQLSRKLIRSFTCDMQEVLTSHSVIEKQISNGSQYRQSMLLFNFLRRAFKGSYNINLARMPSLETIEEISENMKRTNMDELFIQPELTTVRIRQSNKQIMINGNMYPPDQTITLTNIHAETMVSENMSLHVSPCLF